MALGQGQEVIFKSGKYNDYLNMKNRESNVLYFCEDTLQVFRGDEEYTKSILVVDSDEVDSYKAQEYPGKFKYVKSTMVLSVSSGNAWLPVVSGGPESYITHSQIDALFSSSPAGRTISGSI